MLLKVKDGTPEEAVASLLKDMEDLQAAVGSSVVQLTIGKSASALRLPRDSATERGAITKSDSKQESAVKGKREGKSAG